MKNQETQTQNQTQTKTLEQAETKLQNGKSKKVDVRQITVIAIMAAIAAILMILEFSIPIMPVFIKLDFSDLPALLASFALGPVSGVMVCLIKNLIHLPFTSSFGVGELSNFILGCFFVVPAGLIYKKNKTRKNALIGAIIGAFCMAAISLVTNYFIVYPVYANFMPMEAIIAAYSAILPGVDSLFDALLIFNVPFTFFKGICDVILTFLIYKRIAPVIKGTAHTNKKSRKTDSN